MLFGLYYKILIKLSASTDLWRETELVCIIVISMQ